MMYDTAEYAASRINNTIVMHKRKPFLVDHVIGGGAVTVVGKRLDKSRRKVRVDASSVSLVSFKLGFINKNGNAYYMSRKAMRNDWRQGLRPNNVQCVPYMEPTFEDIAKCLLGRYPTLAQAIAKAVDSGGSCAWCSTFCVTSLGLVRWKSYEVGKVEGDVIVLSREFKFLYKELKGYTHGCYEVV